MPRQEPHRTAWIRPGVGYTQRACVSALVHTCAVTPYVERGIVAFSTQVLIMQSRTLWSA